MSSLSIVEPLEWARDVDSVAQKPGTAEIAAPIGASSPDEFANGESQPADAMHVLVEEAEQRLGVMEVDAKEPAPPLCLKLTT